MHWGQGLRLVMGERGTGDKEWVKGIHMTNEDAAESFER